MRETSNTYKTLRTQTGAFYDVEVVRGNTTYTVDDLVTIGINPKLFDGNGPSIGNAASALCYITLIESSDNWPRMAEFTIRVRLSSEDGLTKSEWLSLGTFYTDSRTETKDGFLQITAYDSMLMTEQYWTDAIDPEDLPSTWPITSKAWIDLVEDAGLIEIDSRSVIDDTVPLIGLNTASTIRDILRTIAAAHGGNWIVTPDCKLRLVPFVNGSSSDNPAIAGIAIAGIAVVGDAGGEIRPSGVGTTNLGFDAQRLETSPALLPITGVHLTTEVGTPSDAGTNSGYVLNGTCNFSSSAGVAALCLSKVSGYVYNPFRADVATLDPAAEPGDIVVINTHYYQMMDIDWNICSWPTATLAAGFEAEVDHEYVFVDETAKTLRKVDAKLLDYPTNAVMESAIRQSAESIELSVSENYYNKDTVDSIQQGNESQFTLTSQQIQAMLSQISTIEGEVEAVNYYVRYEVIDGIGTVIVGQTDSLAELHITNGQIAMVYNGEAVSYWNQNQQYTPKKLEIPVGGSLKLGNVQWQPRTSGNLSVFLVNS